MRLATSRVLIDGQTSRKVINAAINGIDGNTLDICPDHAIGRGTHHDIVSTTVRFKAAVGPDNVNLTRRVDFSGRQRATTIRCLLDMVGHRRDNHRIIPTRSPVRRSVGIDMVEIGSQVGSIDRYNHATAGLYERLSSLCEEGLMLWARWSRPGEASIGGGAHQNTALEVAIVPFHVAMAIVRAIHRLIAYNPFLVQIVVGTSSCHYDLLTPCQASISGATDEDGDANHIPVLNR